jgi:predicted O-methyltransferase YrrM
VKPIESQIPGWMDEKELGWLYETAKGVDSAVEIGSWRGRSTHAILSGCKGPVTAIDSWSNKAWVAQTYPPMMAYREFMANVGHFENLTVMRMDSLQAVKAFEDKSVGMVFIDGDHTYKAFKADIEAWIPKAKKILCGHDYGVIGCEGVKEVVDEMFEGKFNLCGSIWSVSI